MKATALRSSPVVFSIMPKVIFSIKPGKFGDLSTSYIDRENPKNSLSVSSRTPKSNIVEFSPCVTRLESLVTPIFLRGTEN